MKNKIKRRKRRKNDLLITCLITSVLSTISACTILIFIRPDLIYYIENTEIYKNIISFLSKSESYNSDKFSQINSEKTKNKNHK